MFDLATTMQLSGWLVIGVVMFLFAATGGFDLGAGILLPFVGRNDNERRVVVNVVGPTWDGNQVWLVTFGGALFAILPRAFAAVFSGFYLAILLILWALFFRPVGFEYRSKMPSQSWRTFWDWALFAGSLIPTLLFGVAIGNLLLGIPFTVDPMSLRFTYTGTFFTLLRPFALLSGVVGLSLLVMHGAAYLLMRTTDHVYHRTKIALKGFSVLFIISFAIAGIWAAFFAPGYHLLNSGQTMIAANKVTVTVGGWMANYAAHPWLAIAPILAFLAAIMTYRYAQRDKTTTCFVASLLTLLGTIGTFGVSMFPFIVPSSTNPGQSLLLWNSSSSTLSLIGIVVVTLVMLPIIFFYTAFVYKKMWGRDKRMSVAIVEKQNHILY